MATLKIGVSGINNIDNPGPGIGVARSLKEDSGLDVRILGLAYDAMDPGLYMDWVVDKGFLLPYPSGSGEEILARLFEIRERHGLDLIIPNLDAELPFYIRYAGALEAGGIATFLPSMAQFRLRGKDRLGEIARQTGCNLPRTEVVGAPEQFQGALERIGLPAMVKGCFYKAYRAATGTEAAQHFEHLAAEWGYPVLLQEIVSGEELNVVGLGDGEGGVLGLVAIKKMLITALGKIWTGVTVKHEGVLGAAAAFVRAFKWRGPFEFECIVDGERIHLVEINPRFPAWSYFATGVGVNLAAALVRRRLGLEPPPPADYEAGRLFVRYTWELVTGLEPFRHVVTRGETSQ